MIKKWEEMTRFWLKMDTTINMEGAPNKPRCEQGAELVQGLSAEVAELLESFAWKQWRSHEDHIDKENIKREIVDCLFFLHHIAHNFGISKKDLEEKFTEVMANNKKRYHDHDFSSDHSD